MRFVAVGKKGRSTLAFRGRDASDAFVGFSDGPAYADAQAIAHRVAEVPDKVGLRLANRKADPNHVFKVAMVARPAKAAYRSTVWACATARSPSRP